MADVRSISRPLSGSPFGGGVAPVRRVGGRGPGPRNIGDAPVLKRFRVTFKTKKGEVLRLDVLKGNLRRTQKSLRESQSVIMSVEGVE